jgi:hypothetical protein
VEVRERVHPRRRLGVAHCRALRTRGD